MRYRVRKVIRWGGELRGPGEIIEHIPGRNYDAMIERGAIERVVEVEKPSKPASADDGEVKRSDEKSKQKRPSKPVSADDGE